MYTTMYDANDRVEILNTYSEIKYVIQLIIQHYQQKSEIFAALLLSI